MSYDGDIILRHVEKPMHVNSGTSPSSQSAQKILAGHLLQLAEDTDRAGLRPEASILAALAYSVLDWSAERSEIGLAGALTG